MKKLQRGEKGWRPSATVNYLVKETLYEDAFEKLNSIVPSIVCYFYISKIKTKLL